MAEQTFKSPGFFEREIDLSQTISTVSGVPAGIAGTAEMGPAFVPVTVGSFVDFENRFGTLDPDRFGPYAVNEFLKHRTAVTYVRVLGGGANKTSTDFNNTKGSGIVKGAGFVLSSSATSTAPSGSTLKDRGRKPGCVQFIAARHFVSSSFESVGYPMLSDNDSMNLTDNMCNMIRAVLFTASGSKFEILSMNSASYAQGYSTMDDVASVGMSNGHFKLFLSSSAGSNFGITDGFVGVKAFTASLNPEDPEYIGNILNTDPLQFQSQQHLLYAHFPIENEIASVDRSMLTGSVSLVSGSANGSAMSGLGTGVSFNTAFGRFDTRFTTPSTTMFISQPFGDKEYDLFKVESISDGEFANTKFKISIRDIKKPLSPGIDPYGTFTLEVREFSDTDTATNVMERYPLCTLNPKSPDYIARKVGDYKAFYNFDADLESERKVIVGGKYPNLSRRIRIVTTEELDKGNVPEEAIPFGFRGIKTLKTNDGLTENSTALYSALVPSGARASRRLGFVQKREGYGGTTFLNRTIINGMTGSIMPPVPMRFKVTRNALNKSPSFTGQHGELELVDARYYWGVKFTKIEPSGSSFSDAIFRSNEGSSQNKIIENFSKFIGIEKLDTLVTGSGADKFNNNKFTLARVSLYNSTGSYTRNLDRSIPEVITGSAKEHMLDAAYIRNGRVDPDIYTIADGNKNRLTFASLASLTSSVYFNKFSDYTKFTTFLHGGFDGLNILDKNMYLMNDKASSSDTGGYATSTPLDIGLDTTANSFGSGDSNAIVNSYRSAARILTDEISSRANIVIVPGIRDTSLTNFILGRLKEYGKAFYIMDIPSYDASQNRLFDGDTEVPNVEKTAQVFAGRSVDNNYSGVYFPNVRIQDDVNNRPVPVPASIAALGALAYSDSISYPWFAPAGFNRGSLGFVTNTDVRLNQEDRDTLYDQRINPIASFPNAGFVIFGQKTLQIAKSSLDRVNVRRMLLEVRRLVGEVAERIVFEQNTPATRARFVAEVTPLLSNVQSQQGIDQFKVIMDSSNNSTEDVNNNILNGRIVIVPTRAVEFIAMDFIITNSGVDFA